VLEDRAPSLFVPASQFIHSKRDTLQLRVLIKIVEVHDFTPQSDSDSDDGGDGSSDDSVGDGMLDPILSSSLMPWPRIFRLADESSVVGRWWPSLPQQGAVSTGPLAWIEAGPMFRRCHHVNRPEALLEATNGTMGGRQRAGQALIPMWGTVAPYDSKRSKTRLVTCWLTTSPVLSDPQEACQTTVADPSPSLVLVYHPPVVQTHWDPILVELLTTPILVPPFLCSQLPHPPDEMVDLPERALEPSGGRWDLMECEICTWPCSATCAQLVLDVVRPTSPSQPSVQSPLFERAWFASCPTTPLRLLGLLRCLAQSF
jgi:hypothetical protein